MISEKERGEVALQTFKKMDWKMLRGQKLHLLEVLAGKELNKERIDSLQGILHLIDAVQDDAVDRLDFPHDEVFAVHCDCGEEIKNFVHNCSGSSNMPEFKGCPKCDDHCAECK